MIINIQELEPLTPNHVHIDKNPTDFKDVLGWFHSVSEALGGVREIYSEGFLALQRGSVRFTGEFRSFKSISRGFEEAFRSVLAGVMGTFIGCQGAQRYLKSIARRLKSASGRCKEFK